MSPEKWSSRASKQQTTGAAVWASRMKIDDGDSENDGSGRWGSIDDDDDEEHGDEAQIYFRGLAIEIYHILGAGYEIKE